jgi:hypothetical protein
MNIININVAGLIKQKRWQKTKLSQYKTSSFFSIIYLVRVTQTKMLYY